MAYNPKNEDKKGKQACSDRTIKILINSKLKRKTM
jgi:hypothetical protein